MNTATGADHLSALLTEYELARRHSLDLVAALDQAQVDWRPHDNSSAIGWHLGHQAAVNHYLVRNLLAAEPSIDPDLDGLFDSATPEPDRGRLPLLADILDYRDRVAAGTRAVIEQVAAGDVGAPAQLALVADGVLRAVINHEYQHAAWMGGVRATLVDDPAPSPQSTTVVAVDGYWTLPVDFA